MTSLLLLLEDLVLQEFGRAVLASVRAVSAEHSVSSGSVERARAFVGALAEVRRQPMAEVSMMVGTRLVAPVLEAVPALARRNPSTRAMLLQVAAVSHEVVDALMHGAEPPAVDVALQDAKTLRLTVVGSLATAAMVEGIVQGLAAYFSERVVVRRVEAPAGVARQLLDVVFDGERRSGSGSPPSPPGIERRSGVLDGVTTFLK